MNATSDNVTRLPIEPRIIPRESHAISRSMISENALKVLYRLKNADYKAYLVGGGVRDILLGIPPKDFDVVTDARPEQIRELFRNCRLIGRRFRLAHVRFGDEIIEVSTFRAPHHISDEVDGHTRDGRIIRDNVYGDIDDDVWRRDFTINALFYNIADFSIVDYVGGVRDLEAKELRLIGDPKQRYIEDPVRMLRAVRFAAKLDLSIHPDAEKPIAECADLLNDIPPARLFEEVLKLFINGCAEVTFELLVQYKLFKFLFPQTDLLLGDKNTYAFVSQVFKNTDQRLKEGNTVAPGFLLAALLWHPMRQIAEEHISHGLSEPEAVDLAGDTVISKQISNVALPRRFTQMAREIWAMQIRLKKINKRAFRVLINPRFRAAYDFLLLRAQAGEKLDDMVEYWTQAQVNEPMGNESNPAHRKRRNNSRRRSNKQTSKK